VSYSVMYKAAGIQNVSSVGLTAYTTDYLRKNGYLAGLDLSQTAIYDFGGSIVSVGLSLSLAASAFDKDGPGLDQGVLQQIVGVRRVVAEGLGEGAQGRDHGHYGIPPGVGSAHHCL
ncbi:MAG TPA: hypothetical protein PKB04_11505, partial [Phenylobacterium sp.]|nr:hypothetical protein [Phenylobacterium sp.]